MAKLAESTAPRAPGPRNRPFGKYRLVDQLAWAGWSEVFHGEMRALTASPSAA